MRLFKYILPILMISFYSCEQTLEDIEVINQLEGKWEMTSKNVKEYINGSLTKDFTFSDTTGLAEIEFFDNGNYKVDDGLRLLKFGKQNNPADTIDKVTQQPQDSLGGVYEIIGDNQIHFDKGLYELFNLPAALLEIVSITENEIVLVNYAEDTSDIYDFARLRGREDGITGAVNSLLSNDSLVGATDGNLDGYGTGFTDNYSGHYSFDYHYYDRFVANYFNAGFNPNYNQGYSAAFPPAQTQGATDATNFDTINPRIYHVTYTLKRQ